MAPTRYQKSSLNAYSLTEQTVAATSPIVLQTIGEKSGCSINFTAGDSTVTLAKPGLYYIEIDTTFTDNNVSGDVSLNIYKNGTAIPGATVTRTVTASGTDVFDGSTSTLVQVSCSCRCVDNSAKITFVNSGVSAIYNTVNVNIFKIA